jgi:peptidoglycan/LPS O-acetylase OafA/YrhL
MFGSLNIQFKAKKQAAATTLIVGILLFFYGSHIYKNFLSFDKNFSFFGNGINPPGVTLMIYGLLVGMFVFVVTSLMELYNCKIALKILGAMSFCGKYSLYIFLYHLAVQSLLNRYLPPEINENMWLKRLIFFGLMTAVPVLLAHFYYKLAGIYKKAVAKYYLKYNSPKTEGKIGIH